jgi:hypothetical protein
MAGRVRAAAGRGGAGGRAAALDGGLMAYRTSLYGLYQPLAWYVERNEVAE